MDYLCNPAFLTAPAVCETHTARRTIGLRAQASLLLFALTGRTVAWPGISGFSDWKFTGKADIT